MGLGLMEDGGGGECQTAAAPPSVCCSVCFEVVTDVGDRSWAKLRCGHQFHLDCIGSAFNAKGAMQCPNCRNVEKGQWLYSNGCGSVSDFSMEDLVHVHDDDLFEYYSGMSVGVHWCPFSGLTRLPPSVEGEFSSNPSNPCPYIAYLEPIHPSSQSNRSISEGSSFNSFWTGPSAPGEAPVSYAYNSMDANYRRWDPSSPFQTNSQVAGMTEQPSMASVAQRITRNNSDVPRHGVHPFVMEHSSAAQAPSSIPSPVPPRFTTNVGRVPSLRHYQQPPGRMTTNRRVTRARTEPETSSSDQTSGFYFLSSSSSAFQEAENHYHGWGQGYPNPAPLNLVDPDSIWTPLPAPVPARSDTRARPNSARQRRHGSERIVPSHFHHS